MLFTINDLGFSIAGLLLEEGESQTPLQKKMAEISKTLSFLCLAVCGVMFGLGLLQGKELLGMFLTAVSLAVAAIPEGLPAIVTIVLAMGVQRMAGRGAIVKRLPAVETLGCASVICSDKTGTLTQNRMTVKELWVPQGGARREALTAGALCSDARLSWSGGTPTAEGDPTETALVETVGVFGGVDGILVVVCAHDDPDECGDDGGVSHGGAEPPLAILACGGTEVFCGLRACRLAAEGAVGAVKGGIVVASSVVRACVDEADESACAALDGGEA